MRGFTFVVIQPQVLVGVARGDAAPRRALQEPQLQQVRLVHVHDGVRLLADGGGDGVQTHRPAAELLDDGAQHLVVQLVQPQMIDFEPRQRLQRRLLGYHAVALHLRVVPHPAQQSIRHARGAAGSSGDLPYAVVLRHDIEQPGGALDDGGDGVLVVEIEAVHRAEAVAQRCAEHGEAGGGPHQREVRQVQPQAPRPRPLAQYYV